MEDASAGSGQPEELFILVDSDDRVLGSARRAEVHGDPSKIHRVAHVLVWNSAGELYLQLRSRNKLVQPLRWDTSVGGHVSFGESYEQAAIRETAEELGITDCELAYLYTYRHRNEYESEYVATFECSFDGPITANPEEIERGRFWTLAEIQTEPRESFTPNLLEEIRRYLAHKAQAADGGA